MNFLFIYAGNDRTGKYKHIAPKISHIHAILFELYQFLCQDENLAFSLKTYFKFAAIKVDIDEHFKYINSRFYS